MNTKNLDRVFFEYKQIYPDLTQDEILQLIAIDTGIKLDVNINFEKYNAERFIPKKHVEYKKVKVAFNLADAKLDKPKSVDHLGREFDSRAEMCAHWGINSMIYHSRDMKGWDLERILTTPIRKRRTTAQTIADNIEEWNKKNV